MIVDVDLGNTLIKWRSSDQPEMLDSLRLGEALPRAWGALAAGDRMRIASVLNPEKTAAFLDDVRRCTAAAVEVARVRQGFAGLQLAYADPSSFGVDRWLALLGARARFPARDCVVVSGGTALTVDWVTAQGSHLGGYIAPGWRTAARALWQNTDQLHEARRDIAPRFQPGATTLECIAAGTTLLFQGFATRLRQEAEAELSAPQWVFTGGDAGTLLEFFMADGSGFFKKAADGSFKKTADGSFKKTADGSFREAADGSFPETAGGIFTETAGGTAAHEAAQVVPRLVLEGLAIALP